MVRHPLLMLVGYTRRVLKLFSVILQAGGVPILNVRRH
jgi:hypothetical protein